MCSDTNELSSWFHSTCQTVIDAVAPLKPRQTGFAMGSLMKRLDEVRAWMALNFLHLNEKNTEVIVFGPSANSGSSLVDLGPLQQFVKPTVTNLGVKVDSGFGLDRQVSAMVKSSYLRQLAKIKPFLSTKPLETVIHALVTTRLIYCNSLFIICYRPCPVSSWYKMLLHAC